MTRRSWSKSLRNNVNELENTGLTTCRLGLGCGTFGREIDQDASFAIMDHAMELGIILFDTAEAYGRGHEMHSSELIVGRWLRSRGIRREVTLVTKAWENLACVLTRFS